MGTFGRPIGLEHRRTVLLQSPETYRIVSLAGMWCANDNLRSLTQSAWSVPRWSMMMKMTIMLDEGIGYSVLRFKTHPAMPLSACSGGAWQASPVNKHTACRRRRVRRFVGPKATRQSEAWGGGLPLMETCGARGGTVGSRHALEKQLGRESPCRRRHRGFAGGCGSSSGCTRAREGDVDSGAGEGVQRRRRRCGRPRALSLSVTSIVTAGALAAGLLPLVEGTSAGIFHTCAILNPTAGVKVMMEYGYE